MATKSVNKPKTLEVIQGELYVFGNKLPRHPEFPWLFSATALHKFCEKAIRNDAKRNQVDDEKYYNAKRPAQWLRYNVLGENNTEQVAYWAKYTRRRIKKYGPNLGFAEQLPSPNTRADNLSDLEIVCVTAKGNSTTIVQGTYLSIEALRDYATFFSLPVLSQDFHSLFPTSSEKIASTVKKLSSTRSELEFSKYLLGLAKYHNASLENQRPELEKYRVDFCFKSKSRGIWFIEYDEDHHESQQDADEERWEEIQDKYRSIKKLPKCGLLFTRVKEGEEYEFIAKFSEYLTTGNSSKLSFIHIASK